MLSVPADEATSALPEGLRRVTDADADGVIALVGAAYDEYPGCVLDLPGIDDDLLRPGTTAARRGSPWWVVVREGAVVATIGAGSRDAEGRVELKRLYVRSDHRGRGLATSLIGVVERQAAGLGAEQVELWSDTRFETAHRRYTALGYAPTGETRQLHDPSDTTEYRFVRTLAPAAPEASVTWHGPHGPETAHLTALPDGWSLTSEVPGAAATVAVEVDRTWRTRRAEVVVAGRPRRLTCDAEGTWWLDGTPASWLTGAVDVDVEVTPSTNTLPIRRLSTSGTEVAEVTAAWVRVPGDGIELRAQHYARTGPDRWRYRSASSSVDLTVDEHGLVEAYGELWRRA
jgi:putative acetyltransferase